MKLSFCKWSCDLVLLVVATSGCGGSAGVTLAPVQGKVTVGGSQPFAKGLVRFIPAPGSNLNSREATTDSQGNFTVEFFPGKPGLQPGQYTVMFSLYQMSDGSPPPDQSREPDPKHPTALGAVQQVPPDFEFGKASECAVMVAKGKNRFEFDLPELKPQTTAGRR